MRRRCKGSKIIIKHRFESYFIRIFYFPFANWFHLKCESFIFLHVSLVQSKPLRTMRIIHSTLGISKYCQVHRNTTKIIYTKSNIRKFALLIINIHQVIIWLVPKLHSISCISQEVDNRIFDGKFLLKLKIYDQFDINIVRAEYAWMTSKVPLKLIFEPFLRTGKQY